MNSREVTTVNQLCPSSIYQKQVRREAVRLNLAENIAFCTGYILSVTSTKIKFFKKSSANCTKPRNHCVFSVRRRIYVLAITARANNWLQNFKNGSKMMISSAD